MPDFTILYAKRKFDELVNSIKRSMKILGLITNIPIAILVAFGEEFFFLWVPNQDPKVLQILSILTVSIFIINGTINSLYNVFTVTNKVKVNALMLIFTGILNVLVVLVLLKTTNLGIYAVVGVSSLLEIVTSLFFVAPYGAKCLGLKWYTFYSEIFKSVMGFIVILVVGIITSSFIEISGWVTLILCSLITAILGIVINLLIIFNKQERKSLIKTLKLSRQKK